ncbi:MAG: dodecin family protein [Thermoanaerobaculia bacterium]|nr:dodecin family protein [Thermoanaerobaculia bacterium]
MSVAKVIEINASSKKNFEDAIEKGIAKASETVKNITGAWVNEEKVVVKDGKVSEWRVNMKVSFVID